MRATTVTADTTPAASHAAPTIVGGGWINAARVKLALAALIYVPLLLTHRGKVSADTKTYLYLDPGRLMARAPELWDHHIGLGTVTHQNIGYLWPQGPWYWLFDRVGVPDWIAQRLWLGTLLFVAALGVLFLLRLLDVGLIPATLAALAYALNPYSLDYAARISALLMPWAALPWLIGLVILALRRGGWRYPAVFALVAMTVGSVNLPSLLYAGLGPATWLVVTVWVEREVPWRRGLATAGRIAVLLVPVCLWWSAGLLLQGNYSLPILRFTESVEAVANSSSAAEIMRGLGYWFFYGRDKLGPWIEPARFYTQFIPVITLSFCIPIAALAVAGFTRWRYRRSFVIMMLVGLVVAVGAHPYDSPSPLGAAFKQLATGSLAGMALRSTGRAVPLVILSLSTLLGVGVVALATYLRSITTPSLHRLGQLLPGITAVAIILNLPPLYTGNMIAKNLQRDEDIPAAWNQAAQRLDAQPDDTRVLEIPGADFAAYSWGNTVDPITPGLIDRPYVARELVPYGSAPSAAFLNAFDHRLQEGISEPSSLAAIAQLLGAGDIVYRADLQYERFNTPRPRQFWDWFRRDIAGLREPETFGDAKPNNTTKFPMTDEYHLGADPQLPWPPSVVVRAVDEPRNIVRTVPAAAPQIVAGDAEGVVDLAESGLLDVDDPVLFAATFTGPDAALSSRIEPDSRLILTDTNRRRARRWSTVRENTGYTEAAGEKPLRTDLRDVRLDVFPDATDDSYTVATYQGVKSISATDYGNAISYTPEDRPAMAIDGDDHTAWRTGGFVDPRGEFLRIEFENPQQLSQLRLLQPITGARNRFITKLEIRFSDGTKVERSLDGTVSRERDGQLVTFDERSTTWLELEVVDTNVPPQFLNLGYSSVGFAEIAIPDVSATEAIRLPTDLLDAVGTDDLAHPLDIVMTRLRSWQRPARDDEEPVMRRQFTLPSARSFELSGAARISAYAPDEAIDWALGQSVPEWNGAPNSPAAGEWVARSCGRLPGALNARAASAFDDDPATVWQPGLGTSKDCWVELELPSAVTLDHLDVDWVNDAHHSQPAELLVTLDDSSPISVDIGDVAPSTTLGTTSRTRVSFPPTTARTVRVAIAATKRTTTFEYFSESRLELPVALADIAVGDFIVPSPGPATNYVCRDDLLAIDGAPVWISVVGSTADASALDRGALAIKTCGDHSGPLELTAGEHTIESRLGRVTGVDIDRLILRSAAGGTAFGSSATASSDNTAAGAAANQNPAAGAVLRTKEHGSSRIDVALDSTQNADSSAPYWLVLGQSWNKGWTAKVAGGRDLGEPVLINGYANGWLIEPERDGSTPRVELEWTPQRAVSLALRISGLAILVALALVVWGRPRGRSYQPSRAVAQWSFAAAQPTRARSARSKVLVVAVAGLAALAAGGPWVCLAAIAGCYLTLWRPTAWVGIVPAVLLAIGGAYTTSLQLLRRFEAALEWVLRMSVPHLLAWSAAVVVGIVAWLAHPDAEPPTEGSTEPPTEGGSTEPPPEPPTEGSTEPQTDDRRAPISTDAPREPGSLDGAREGTNVS